jgi:hypothetical protein
MNLPEPGSRTGFHLYPTDTRTLVSTAQSNESTATDSARVTPPAPWMRQGDCTLRLERTAPSSRTHTPPNAMIYQGNRIRDQQVAVGTNNMTALLRRGPSASTRGADLFGQRGPTVTQPNSENMNPRLNPNPGKQEVVYSSSSDAPFGEAFNRALDVFQQPFFQNSGDVTTVAPQSMGRRDVAARTVVTYHRPRSSTTTRYYQLPAQAGATGSGGRSQMTVGQRSLIEQQSAQSRARLRALRAARQAPPPAQIQHFSTLLSNDSAHEPECAICQESYDDKEHTAIRLQKVNCIHVFGRSCLQQWVNSGMGNAHRCPNCRRDITAALSHTVLATPLPAENGTAGPAHLPAGRASAAELARRFSQYNVYGQEELHQARRAREEARQVLSLHRQEMGDRRVEAGFSASTSPRQPAPSDNTHQTSVPGRQQINARIQEVQGLRAEVIRATASDLPASSNDTIQAFETSLQDFVAHQEAFMAHHQELETRRQELEAGRQESAVRRQQMEVHRAEVNRAAVLRQPAPSDEARQALGVLHPQPNLPQPFNAGRLGAANPSHQTTREAPRARRVSRATMLQMDYTLRSQAAELAAFDADAARQTKIATASSHEEANVLATRISRERAAMFGRHSAQIMALTRHISREHREREAEDDVLRR